MYGEVHISDKKDFIESVKTLGASIKRHGKDYSIIFQEKLSPLSLMSTENTNNPISISAMNTFHSDTTTEISSIINSSSSTNNSQDDLIPSTSNPQQHSIILCIPEGESEEDQIACRCTSKNDYKDLPSSISKAPDFVKVQKGVAPLELEIDHYLLTGKITSAEALVESWPINIPIMEQASFSQLTKLRLTRSIKEGALPFLTMHNLSQLINMAPCLGMSARSTHFCIFCGNTTSQRVDLLTHIQRFHTGFWSECHICHKLFLCEKSYKRHHDRMHPGNKLSIGFICPGSGIIYNGDTSTAGQKAKDLTKSISNRFTDCKEGK